MKRPLRSTLAAGLAVAIGLSAATMVAQEQSETFTGMVANLGAGPTAGTLQITINTWTTPEQRLAFATELAEKGQKSLINTFERAEEMGFARFPGSLGWPIVYAWQIEADGKRIIRLATHRPVAFGEARAQTRTMDYPFGIIEMRLGPDGKGEGDIYSAASLKFNKDNVLEIESYGIGPQRFLSITTQKK
jgi:hypothetical protein